VPVIRGQNLPSIPWSRRTAFDPKHRPQIPERPATTVRREWARYPQEAHLLDSGRTRIRRITASEIARLQGFEASWFEVPGVSSANRIRAAGNAVPPAMAAAVLRTLADSIPLRHRTHLELCAGAGGLASGLAGHAQFEVVALLDSWSEACRILRYEKPWAPDVVHLTDIRRFDYTRHRNTIGILSGGLPCQPWSRAGNGLGPDDPRDLLGNADELVAAARPEAFVFENVPGLVDRTFADYLSDLLRRLRHPGAHLHYGVMAGILNAADFGVPQNRRRLFIVGLLDGMTRDVAAVFDRIDARASHRAAASWVTVGEALGPDLERGPWMRWPYGRTKLDEPPRLRSYRSRQHPNGTSKGI
jgi:site-specific DNA-cytosine methylase